MRAPDLLIDYDREGGFMTKVQWFLLGAVLLGVAIVVYLLFFCPAECQ
jgi:hypothetical protein